MPLHNCSEVVGARVKRGSKTFTVYMVTLLVLLVPNQHRAQPFADDEMLQRLKDEYSEAAQKRGIALNALLEQLSGKEISQQLARVNDFFNQFTHKDDSELWGQKDYWATPEEFIGLNSGDCEDDVVAKYFALRSLGVPDKNLYLT